MKKNILFIVFLIGWLIPKVGFSQITTIRAVGGGGKNINWPKIKADTEREENANGGGPGFFYIVCGQDLKPQRASSTLANQGKYNYNIKNVSDANPMTAWVEGKSDYGIGEYFEIKATGVNTIYNGHQASPKSWIENSRVKKFKVYKNNIAICFLELTDEMGGQSFELPDHNRHSSKESIYRFEIVDIYKGTKWQDVAISEILLVLCCVAESTSVKTDANDLQIAGVKKGSIISTLNIETGELLNTEVLSVMKQRHLSLLKINCGIKEIELTSNHPLFIKDFGFSSISRYMEIKNITNYEKLIDSLELGVWDEFKCEIIFEKVKKIELRTGVFETITIGKLTYGDTFITNGFISRTY